MTDLRLEGEDDKNGQPIYIPYEINHNFFGDIQSNVCELNHDLQGIKIAGPDYGSGYKIQGTNLDKFICDLKLFKDNLDYIVKIFPIPDIIGKVDDGYIEGFKYDNIADNYIEFKTKRITEDDILLLLSLLIQKALEAKNKGICLRFIGD